MRPIRQILTGLYFCFAIPSLGTAATDIIGGQYYPIESTPVKRTQRCGAGDGYTITVAEISHGQEWSCKRLSIKRHGSINEIIGLCGDEGTRDKRIRIFVIPTGSSEYIIMQTRGGRAPSGANGDMLHFKKC